MFSEDYDDGFQQRFFRNPILNLFQTLGSKKKKFQLRLKGCDDLKLNIFLNYKLHDNVNQCIYYLYENKIYK